ncbi:MAG: spmB [Haloplasmataceae bacterium]|jgi:spore maturation protein B|nr:spmB [Haloplasmataceae bacterium]
MDITVYIIPILVALLLAYSLHKKVNAYESFIKGAKEGIKYSIEILPYIASMIIATAVFKGSDFLNTIVNFIDKNNFINIDLITLMVFKPISGMASTATLIEIFKKYGPDSYIGYLGSIISGSTDTTLYIITVYFGAVGIKNVKHSIKAGLLIDLLSFVFAFIAVKILLF